MKLTCQFRRFLARTFRPVQGSNPLGQVQMLSYGLLNPQSKLVNYVAPKLKYVAPKFKFLTTYLNFCTTKTSFF